MILASFGGVLFLCCGAIAIGLLLWKTDILKIAQQPGTEPANSPSNDSSSGIESSVFTPRQVAPAETTPESQETATSDQPTTLLLSDATQVSLPATSHPVRVVLSRLSNTLQLESPGLETSGSLRMLEFDSSQMDENFFPVLTIPAKELGGLDPETTNIVRVGDIQVNGEIIKDTTIFLPFTRDDAGNLVVVDGATATLSATTIGDSGTTTGKLAALKPQAGGMTQVKYVVATFQGHLEWSTEPRLVRMIPDASVPAYRRPADPENEQDKELLLKPVVNIIVLVHGHNESEKDGSTAPSAAEPWGVDYKLDVWIEYYKSFLTDKKDQVDCTAFYEFIYPTYRPAYSPLSGSSADTLGTSLALALKYGATNDHHLLEKMAKAKLTANLLITAHSMGGLVAREAIRQFDGWRQENFKRLVTWGTPHHGSPLISLGYLLHGPYQAVGGGTAIGVLNSLLGGANLNWALDSFVQLDTPGERDLRWDNVQPLRLDQLFTINQAAIPRGKTAAYYDLNKGDFLYNENLRLLNRDDPYQNGERYYFLYGVTSKRFNEPYLFTQTALGASMIETLMVDSSAAVPGLSGKAGDSDGAVPLASMAGLNIANFHSDNLGDLDHEEYYSHSSDVLYGGKVARWSFSRLGLEEKRCTCASLEVENQGDLNVISSLDINAQFSVDPDLDPVPGKRIETAEAFFYIAGTKDEFSLGELEVEDDGALTGSFPMPDLGEGEHQLAVRVRFTDGTQLETIPAPVYNYMSLKIVNGTNGWCRPSGQAVDILGFFMYEKNGPIISWTGIGEFDLEDGTLTPPLQSCETYIEHIHGKLAPDGKSVTIQFDYDCENASAYEKAQGSVINIPFAQHVEMDGNIYDEFRIVGSKLSQIRPNIQLNKRSEITIPGESNSVVEYGTDNFPCDDTWEIVIRMYTSFVPPPD